MSGSFASILTHWFTARKEQVFFLRQKLEQLYLSVETIQTDYPLWAETMIEVLSGGMHHETAKAFQKEASERFGGITRAFDTATMITYIYFPELKPHHEELAKYRKQVDSSIQNAARVRRQYPLLERRNISQLAGASFGLQPARDALDAYRKATLALANDGRFAILPIRRVWGLRKTPLPFGPKTHPATEQQPTSRDKVA